MQCACWSLEVRLCVVVLLPVVVTLLVVVHDLLLGDGLLVVEAVGSGYATDVSQLRLLRAGLRRLRSVLGLEIGYVRRLLTAIVCRLGSVDLLGLLRLLVLGWGGATLCLATFGVLLGGGLSLA